MTTQLHRIYKCDT